MPVILDREMSAGVKKRWSGANDEGRLDRRVGAFGFIYSSRANRQTFVYMGRTEEPRRARKWRRFHVRRSARFAMRAIRTGGNGVTELTDLEEI